MPEIVEHGRTRFLVDDIPGAVRGLSEVANLSRYTCATEARARFSDVEMADSYAAATRSSSAHLGDEIVESCDRHLYPNVRVTERRDQVDTVDHAPARIDDVGHIAVLLAVLGLQKGRV
jgi:hypothetical protein